MLYLLVVWRGLKVVTVARDAFSAIAAAGIVFAFLFQIFVNVGMTIGIAPVTGIPLADGQRRRLVDGREPARDRRAAGDPRPRPRPQPAGALVVPKTSLPVKPGAVLGVLKELRASAKRDEPLVVSGANELVGVLRRELARGGESGRPSGSRGRSKEPLRSCTSLQGRSTPTTSRR